MSDLKVKAKKKDVIKLLPKYKVKNIVGGIGEIIIDIKVDGFSELVEVRIPKKKYSFEYAKKCIEVEILHGLEMYEIADKLFALGGKL